ncbi:hypothetical protein UG55_1007185 [Frankia sp. EI5c]|uniref:hypothetical protein n=1 Tax=Frankia sp. EI5c TaxID=683316 RepID=UPI0007C31D30|nr:hypothetical protein [Frankia sp. EI5c]OAA27857.1 hypothetical protein UG55_1007185 [Frankia sp. EI5c]
MTEPAPVEPWAFGVEALAQTERAAARLRRVTGLVLALEHEDPALDLLLDALEAAERELAPRLRAGGPPRVGPEADGPGRVYLDHSRHIGAFNPMFPEYEISVAGDRAEGTVTFPIAYEGPPGLVHGGFLALFFDAAIQHHNCELGVAGKTASLSLRYRRPTPLLAELRFVLARSADGARISSTGQLLAGDVVLCEAEMTAVRGDRSRLPAVSPRRAVT